MSADANEQAAETGAEVLTAPSKLEIREEFVDMIRRELLGPAGGPEEIITEPTVRDRYAVGLLAPLNATEVPDPEDERGPLATDESDTVEEGYAEGELPGFGAVDLNEAASKKSMIPSSIGLTFAIKNETEALKITARWGAYLRQVDEDADETKRYWQRVPIEAETVVSLVDWRTGDKRRWEWQPSDDTPAVTLQGLLDEHG